MMSKYKIVYGKGYKKMSVKKVFENGKYQTLQLAQLVISRLREPLLQKLLTEGKLSTALSDVEDVILAEKEKME